LRIAGRGGDEAGACVRAGWFRWRRGETRPPRQRRPVGPITDQRPTYRELSSLNECIGDLAFSEHGKRQLPDCRPSHSRFIGSTKRGSRIHIHLTFWCSNRSRFSISSVSEMNRPSQRRARSSFQLNEEGRIFARYGQTPHWDRGKKSDWLIFSSARTSVPR
jgi:hypothetical protein